MADLRIKKLQRHGNSDGYATEEIFFVPLDANSEQFIEDRYSELEGKKIKLVNLEGKSALMISFPLSR